MFAVLFSSVNVGQSHQFVTRLQFCLIKVMRNNFLSILMLCKASKMPFSLGETFIGNITLLHVSKCRETIDVKSLKTNKTTGHNAAAITSRPWKNFVSFKTPLCHFGTIPLNYTLNDF